MLHDLQSFGVWPVLNPNTPNLAAQKQYGLFLEAAPEDITYHIGRHLTYMR